MEIKSQNQTGEPLYGLVIHPYRTKEYISIHIHIPSLHIPFEGETPYLLNRGACGSISKLEKRLTDALPKLFKTDLLFDYVTDYIKICANIHQNLDECKNSVRKRWPNQKLMEPTDYHTIENFIFYGRGLLITIIHTLEAEIHKFDRKVASHHNNQFGGNLKSPFAKSCEKTKRKLQVMEICCRMFALASKKLEDEQSVSYFNNDINIDDYSEITGMNVADFMYEIGTQFVPSLAAFYVLLVQGTASHSDSLNSSWVDTSFITNNIYYWFNYELAAEKTNQFFKTVDAHKGQTFWNFHDKAYVKNALYWTLDRVDTSVKFQIPLEEIVKINKVQPKDNLNSNLYYSKESVVDPEITKEIEVSTEKHVSIKKSTSFQLTMDEFDIFYGIMLKQAKLTEFPSISCRLISPYKIDNNFKMKNVSDFPTLDKLSGIWSKIIQSSSVIDEKKKGCLIFHMHGGGFVAMSTFAHEGYLRKWATYTGLPIISIDYRKSPAQKFPLALEECFTAYKWVVQNAESLLGVPLKKIIVCGDSAGGNLSFGITQLAIKEGIRIPDALAVSYPATYLSEAPSPARFCSLIDPLVNYAFLKMCGESYLKKGTEGHNGLENSLISPILAPDEILSKFPPTYINCGTLDPLFDDTIVFAKRLDKLNGGHVKIDLYDGLGHGIPSSFVLII